MQHVWLNRDAPRGRVLYVPKLENEEEAAYLKVGWSQWSHSKGAGLRHAYLKALIGATERAVAARFPDYQLGSVRVLLVFENPRAIFRIREMAQALQPHFLGGSLGWHDFLASTARLFRHDGEYRIPVKADPNIVISNIRESHAILVDDLGACGALKIGG